MQGEDTLDLQCQGIFLVYEIFIIEVEKSLLPEPLSVSSAQISTERSAIRDVISKNGFLVLYNNCNVLSMRLAEGDDNGAHPPLPAFLCP